MKSLSLCSHRRLKSPIRVAMAICCAVLPLQAANVTLKTNDVQGTSSWSTNGVATPSTNWSDGLVPSAVNDYFTGPSALRTPPDATFFTNFAGNSLSVDPLGQLLVKHYGNFTNNNLIWNGGTISLGGGAISITAVTNWGNIRLNATTNILTTDVSTRSIDLRSTIIGTGTTPFVISNLVGSIASNWAGVTISGSNSFTNVVLITGGSVVKINTTNAFGVTNGNTIVTGNSTLDLNGIFPIYEPVVLSGAGTNGVGAVINSGAGIANNGLKGNITFSTNVTLGGPNRWDIASGATLNASNYTLTKVGASEIALGSLGGNHNMGDVIINGGKLTFIGNTTMGATNNTVTINSGGTLASWDSGHGTIYNKVLVLNGGTISDDTTGVTPLETMTNAGPLTVTGSGTLGGSANMRFNNVIAGFGTLTKGGAATNILTVAGTNTFTGNVLVSAGRLVLGPNASFYSAAALTVNSGATLDVSGVNGGFFLWNNQLLQGSGSVTGAVVATPGSAISPGGDGVAGTLMITNSSLALQHQSMLRFDLSGTSTTIGSGNDLLFVNGNLSLTNTNYVVFNIIGTNGPLTGPYTLIKYTGTLSGGAANFVALSHQAVVFDTTSTPGEVRVTFTGGGSSLVWQGDGILNRWNTGGATNWLNGLTPDVFYTGDAVTFNDSGNNSVPISILGPVGPAAVTVNANKDYTLSGPGSITSGALTKSGTGLLTLSTTNNYAGGTIVNGGTVKLGATNALGAPNSIVVATNGGQVDLNGILQDTRAYIYTVSGSGPDGLGAIKNSGTVGLDGAKSGVKTLILAGDTTLGPIQRFDIGSSGYVNGNGFKLTKVGASTLPLRTVSGGVSNISEFIVTAGRLYGEGASMQMTSVVTVLPGASVGAWVYDFFTRVTNTARINLNGGALGAEGAQSANITNLIVWTGPVYVNADSFLNSAQASAATDTQLEGALIGTSNLTVVPGAGPRTVIIATNNDATFSGNWTVNAPLRFGSNGTPGTGVITNNSTVEWLRTAPYTFGGRVLGGTMIHQIGADQLTLTGSNVLSSLRVQSTNAARPLILGNGSSNIITGDLQLGQDYQYGKMIIQPGANLLVNGNYMLGNGASRTGEVVQLGGNVSVLNTIRIGHFGTEVSSYVLGGGNLTIPTVPQGLVNPSASAETNGVLYIGVDGVGVLTQTGGVLNVPSMVLDSRTSTILGTATNTYSLEGGQLILGAQGIKSGSTDGNTTYQVNLGGGTVGASADWTSSRALSLSGTNGSVTFDSGPNTITLSGQLYGPGGFSKSGSGALVISGNTQYTNNAVVNAGSLIVNGTLGTNSGTTTVSGGVLGGSGVIRTPLAIQSGGTLTAGTNGFPGTLTVSNDITVSGRLLFDLATATTTGGGVNDLIIGRSNLTLTGTIPVAFNFLNGAPALGTAYTLMQYTTVSGDANNLVSSSHYGAVFTVSGGLVQVVFTGASSNLTWVGDGVANAWDQGGTQNWTNGVSMDFFGSGDAVTFNDTGSNNLPILLSGVLSPGSLTISANKDYNFAGSGRIAGVTGLTKSGTGTLTLTNANDYIGNTVISGGTVVINGDSSLGTAPASYAPGKLVLNGGKLLADNTFALSPARGITVGPSSGSGSGTINVSAGNMVDYGGIITNNGAGAGSLVKSGVGTLRLGNSNTFTGGTVISQGALWLRSTISPLGLSGTVQLGDANTGSADVGLLLDGLATAWNFNRPIVVSASGSGKVIIGSTIGSVANPQFTNTITINRDVTLVSTNTDRTTFAAPISGTGNINIAGPNRVVWIATNTFNGSVNIIAGQLQLGAGSAAITAIPDAANVNVDTNGQFWLSVNAESINALTGYGVVRPNGPSGAAATLTVGANNGSGVFSGNLGNNGTTDTLHLTKAGSGTQTLNSSNTYAGNTVVNGGTLALGANGSISNSAQISVNNNAIFDATAAGGFVLGNAKSIVGNNGIIKGDFLASSNSTVSPNSSTLAGTLSFSNKLTFDRGVIVNFNLTNVTTVGAGLNDLMIVGGDLVINGPMTLNVLLLAPNLAQGSYRLFNYSGNLIGNATNIALVNNTAGTRYSMAVDTNTPGQVNLVISGGAVSSLTWNGTFALPSWNNTDSNWFNGTGPDRFFTGDNVIFDNTAVQQAVTLTNTVAPGSVTANNTRDYVISGTGKITGLAGITKSGSGMLSLSTTNDFTGRITVNGGILKAGVSNAFGLNTGITVADGAQVDIAGIPSFRTSAYTMSGFGPDGRGALISSVGGAHGNLVCPVGSVTLTGNAGVWAAAGPQVWDFYGGVFDAKGYKLTKLGPGRLDFFNTRVTNLQELVIVEGQVYSEFGGVNNNFGTNATVYAGAIMAMFNDSFADTRITLNGGMLASSGNATNCVNWRGPITLASNSIFGYYNIFNSAGTYYSNHIRVDGTISGPGSLTKLSPTNNLYIGGTNTYTGNTVIHEGRLVLLPTGSISNSATIYTTNNAVFDVQSVPGGFVIASNQALAGLGLVQGTVSDSAGAFVQPGGIASFGTLTISNSLTNVGGGTLVFDLNTVTNEGGTFNDLLVVTNLIVNGPTTLRLNPLFGSVSNATYTLINCSGTLSGQGNLTAALDVPGLTATLDFSIIGKVRVTISGTAAPVPLVWLGDYESSGNSWDVALSLTWFDEAAQAQTIFHPGDTVIFNDSFNNSPTVNLVGTLAPAFITVDSSTDNQFTFVGSGSLGGGGLAKKQQSTLTIANSGVNYYTGPTDIQFGTLQVGNGGTTGMLPPTTITNNGTLVFNRADAITAPNLLVGSGGLVQQGPGILTLSGASGSTFNGPLSVSGGILKATSSAAVGSTNIGAAAITVASGATFDVGGVSYGVKPITISGAGLGGGGAIINSGAAQQNAFQALSLATDATIGGSNRWDVRGTGSVVNLNLNTLRKTGPTDVHVIQSLINDGNIVLNQGAFYMEIGTICTNIGTITANTGQLAFGNWGTPLNVTRPIIMNGASFLSVASSTDADVTSPITLATNTTFDINVPTRLPGVISGPGRLTKISNSNLVLMGANTYTGGTIVSGGTLQVGTNGSGSILGDLFNSATVVFANTNATLFNGNITGNGSGTLYQSGGALRFGGAVVQGGLRVLGGLANPLTFGSGSSANVSGTVTVSPTNSGAINIEQGAGNIYFGNLYLTDFTGQTGQVQQLGGNVVIGSQLKVGHWPNTIATYLMGGGSLTLTNFPAGPVNPPGFTELNGVLYVGVDSVGWFRQTNGVVSANALVVDNRGATVLGSAVSTYTLEGGTLMLGTNGIRTGNLDSNTTYAVNLGGGTVGSLGSWFSPLNMTMTGTNGDVTVDSAAFTNVLTGVLSGPGGLQKAGTGLLLLNGNNTYAGTTLLTAGTLGGIGAVSGPLVVGPNATLNAGSNALGTLTVTNTVTLGGTVVASISKVGTTLTAGMLRSTTPLAYGGNLIVRPLAQAPALTGGDSFKIFDAPSYSGAFSSISLPGLPGGYAWDTTRLTVDGTITVVIAPMIVSFTPTTQNRECGTGDATFTVVASGTAPTYQWYRGASPIPWGNGSTLTITNATIADTGSYSVVVQNAAGMVTGGPGVLTVTDTTAPTIAVNNIIRYLVGESVSITSSDVYNAAGSTDACSGAVTLLSVTPTLFTCPGAYPVTITAHDGNGNTNTAIATVTIVSPASTNLLAYEPFRCYTDGSLAGQSAAGKGFTGTWLSGVGDVIVTNAAGLSYTSGSYVLAGEGGRGVTVGAGADNTMFLGLDTAAGGAFSNYVDGGLIGGPNATGTLYYSFLARNASGDLGGDADFAGVELFNDSTGVLGVGNNLGAWAYSTYGPLGNLDLTNNSAAYAGVNANTHLFVVRIDYAAGADDTVTVWMDPSLNGGELGQGDLYRCMLSGNAAFNRIALHSGSTNDDNSWDFDEIRFGTSWSSVTAPGIGLVTQPISQVVPCGAPVTFTVTSTALVLPAYQWLKNGALLSGQAADTLNIVSASASDIAGYSVILSNRFGVVTSLVATLSISNAPSLISPAGSLAIGSDNACGDTALTGGASYRWEMSDANGAAGTDWDVLNAGGLLDVQATAGTPFAINLVSLNGGALGMAANFDSNATSVWTIATAGAGISNYDAAKFTLDDTLFANDLGGGAFSMVQDGSLKLRFTPNHDPSALGATYTRTPTLPIKIRISELLTNASDVDGDVLFLYGISATSTNGVILSTNDTYIFYTNVNNVTDAFTYTVREVRPYRTGDTPRSATGTVTINLGPSSGTNQNIVSWTVDGSGKPHLRFAGIPGYQYDIQRATNLTPPVSWTTVHTTNAPSEGLFDFVDETAPEGQAYYRTAQPQP